MSVTRRKVQRALAALLVGGGVGAVALSLLVPPSGEPRPVSTTRPACVEPAGGVEPTAPDVAIRTVSCHGALEQPLDAESARLRAAVAELDRPSVSVTELQDLGSVLTRLLSERPELGPAAVAALRDAKERRVLFQLSHALRAVAGVSEIQEELLAAASDTAQDDARREAAILVEAGLGDGRADSVFATLASDERTGVLARSAALYALSRDMETLAPATRASAVAAARALVGAPATPERLLVESFDLLGAAGLDPSDALAAREALSAASDETAFAAARALLASGEGRASVARALRARASDPVLIAQLDLLEGKAP